MKLIICLIDIQIQTMQSINREILNPYFFLVFFGSLILLSVSSISQLNIGKWAFGFMLSASIIYLLGTLGVTMFGNIPLNNKLDVLDLTQMDSEALAAFRSYFEENWNRLQHIRAGLSVTAFLLSIAGLVAHISRV